MTCRRNRVHRAGFSLIEALVSLGIIATLAAVAVSMASRARDAGAAVETASRMRQAGSALLLYAADQAGEFPRSSHSAFGARQRGWVREILPYMGSHRDIANADLAHFVRENFKSSLDQRVAGVGFGLNVYFELDPDFDDYDGSPALWRKVHLLPSAAWTVVLAELKSSTSADHVMAHFWAGSDGKGVEVDHTRHSGQSHYLFADGHVELLALGNVFAPVLGIDRWNPAKAGTQPVN